ncbi:MAG: class I SAM-dependent methyltransferase [Planctomycetes bacterium]|nr:class I SAM-dependent methyltransferase [Planctomycetota bacterium]
MTRLYDRIGHGYAAHRVADPRIAARLRAALAGCASVVNVGAGAGSYEPSDLPVVAVEPSESMIAQRVDRTRTLRAVAESLPLRDGCADAVTAILTIHHWTDARRGLAECARVARRRVVLLTWDPRSDGFWLVQDHFPDLLALDRAIFPTLDAIEAALGRIEVESVPVPSDCVDGFLGAYWRRPEAYLDERVRHGMSTFARLVDVEPRIEALRRELASGAWHARHAGLLARDALDLGYRLVTAKLT